MKHTFPVGLALVLAAFASHAQQYDIYDLGPADGSVTAVNGLNDKAVAVGISAFDIFEGGRPAIFRIGEVPQPVYTPSYGEATAINNREDVIGNYTVGSVTYGFVSRKDIVKTLPSVEGKNMFPLAINNRSEIIGISRGCCDNLTGAWIYRDGRLIDMGAMGGISAAFTAINDRGDITGIRSTADGGEAFIIRNGRMKSVFPILKPESAVPKAINNRGDLAGWMNDGTGPAVGFALINNTLHKIEFGPYINGQANSINDSGQVVGFHYDGLAAFLTGFLWEKGKITRIKDLPDVKAAGWKVIYDARAINNDGVIVGVGYREFNKWRGYMLVPRK